MEEFIFSGNLHHMVSSLMQLGINEYSQAYKITKALQTESNNILSLSGGCHKMTDSLFDNTLIIARGQYYISIKKTSLAILCYLLDATLDAGGLLTLLSTLGLLAPGVQRLSDYEGERCVIVEIIRCENKIGTSSLLDKYSHFCNKPYMNCKFKKSNDNRQSCTCSHKNINEILLKLSRLKILVQNSEGYKYISE